MKNITMEQLLGSNYNSKDYAVSTNWRLDFSVADGISELFGGNVPEELSYACTGNFSQFQSTITYATANIKGIPVRQAAWQSREITSLPITVLEPMDRSLENALLKASNKTAGFKSNRDIGKKSTYTFSKVALYELGNSNGNGDPETVDTIFLYGVQINSVKLGDFTSGDASLAQTSLDLYAHFWNKASEE